jgi:CRP/FNR family transcriptional regulator, cyclic AMP receptor protein
VTEAGATKELESLRRIELFVGLDDDALQRVLPQATRFEVPAAHVLVQPHREATGCFLIEGGIVEVELGDRTIERGPGACVGEMALFTPGALRTARVQAKTDVTGLAIRREDFLAMLEDEPRIAITLLGILAQRLAEA